jgi:hypothetical protein
LQDDRDPHFDAAIVASRELDEEDDQALQVQ